MDPKTHWEHIYEKKAPTRVSWYQEHAQISLQFILRTGIQKTDPIIDIGGGASTLVDDLLAEGYQHISVLDVSAKALELARGRLGERAAQVNWIEADITQVDLPEGAYTLWHDRAAFHFLTQPADRQRYIETARRAVRKGGHVIVATFAPDGPDHCSGLEVMRYSPESLHSEFGSGFELADSVRETHHTPFGTEQKFIYCYCRKQ
ncbi:MAG: class I SAM-dependent methyltransferase [Anaerolineales bacterium]|nr:class I SAM-dependent methyltransferase [Anaerolineales bacterium]NUQ85255.1 class I SAM-dependent methyltransferase [Anaerolineales bacterium]